MGNGLVKIEETALRRALERLRACNRPAYLGGVERYSVDYTIKEIERRLSPASVSRLLETADRVCEPLEHLLENIDRRAALEVLG